MLDKIYDIVAKHFYLEEESLKRFKKLLFNREIDETYTKIIGPDLRYKVKIGNSKPSNDEGWRIFVVSFPSFMEELNPTFENYRKNKIILEKEERRLFKLVKDFYLQNRNAYYRDISPSRGECGCISCRSLYIDYKLQRISEHKLPSKEMYFVLSLNFADWLLCSTEESWSSCLNLESEHEGAYWAGLPGLVADKNIALAYLTNGNKKKWQNIEAEAMLSRSWILLDTANRMRCIKFYPKEILNTTELRNLTSLDIAPIDNNFHAKHQIELLFHKHGDSCYIYQDRTDFTEIKNSRMVTLSYRNFGGGMQIYNKNEQIIFDDTSFYFSDGLSYLIDQKDNLGLYVKRKVSCYNCQHGMSEDNVYLGSDGRNYCESCFYDLFEICESCQETFDKDEMFWPNKGTEGPFCERCFEKYYVICNNCETEVSIDEVYEAGSGSYCESCFYDLFEQCNECEQDFERDNLIFAADEEFYCEDCYGKLFKKCCYCNEEFAKNEIEDHEHNCKIEMTA